MCLCKLMSSVQPGAMQFPNSLGLHKRVRKSAQVTQQVPYLDAHQVFLSAMLLPGVDQGAKIVSDGCYLVTQSPDQVNVIPDQRYQSPQKEDYAPVMSVHCAYIDLQTLDKRRNMSRRIFALDAPHQNTSSAVLPCQVPSAKHQKRRNSKLHK